MRIVIAEDSVLLREGLTRLLAEAGHEVAAAAGDAEGFLRAVAAQRPEAVVVDVRMPPIFPDEGLRAALLVRDRWPDTGVLVLSQWVEGRYAIELISGRPHGVGYLLKDRVADVAELLEAAGAGRGGRQRARPRGGGAAPRPQQAPAWRPHPVPSRASVDLSSGAGDMTVSGGVSGALTLSAGAGDITAAAIGSRDVRVTISAGS